MIRLSSDRVRLTVAPEFGCRWMRLRVKVGARWTDVLTPASLARLKNDPFFDGAYLLAPWCNRIPRAAFRFDGVRHRLRPNFPDGTAIHGDAWGRPWTVTRRTPASLTAAFDSRAFPDFNFPWPVVVHHGVRLTARGVDGWLRLRNPGPHSIPAGLGFHPFLRRAESAAISVAANRHFPARKAVPVGASRPVSGASDARGGRSLTSAEMERGFTALTGDVRVETGFGQTVVLRPGPGAEHIFVWAPQRFRGRRAPFLCVEPMTMSVDGFGRKERGATDSGVRILKPRETLTLRWRIEARER